MDEVVCDLCGRAPDDEADLLTWSTAQEADRRKRFCADCSRRHLRAMEAKLDSEHW